jgi:hypothetical protein
VCAKLKQTYKFSQNKKPAKQFSAGRVGIGTTLSKNVAHPPKPHKKEQFKGEKYCRGENAQNRDRCIGWPKPIEDSGNGDEKDACYRSFYLNHTPTYFVYCRQETIHSFDWNHWSLSCVYYINSQ